MFARAKSRRIVAAAIAAVATLGIAQGLANATMVETGKTPKANPTQSVYPTPSGTAKTIRYSMPTLMAPPVQTDGKHGMAMTGNIANYGVAKPCTNCYITSMQTKLVDPNTGAELNWNTGVVMHHAVLTNGSRDDATCGISLAGWKIGQRFFAAGAEHTKVAFPPGYGYKVGSYDKWNLIYDLMSMAKTDKPVALDITYTYTSSAKAVDPLWLDQKPCPVFSKDFSAYTATGDHTATMTYKGGNLLTSLFGWLFGSSSKKIVFMGGHVHDLGVSTKVTKGSTTLCNSTPGYGENPKYIDHHGSVRLSSMSVCVGTATNPVIGEIKSTDTLTMTTTYALGSQVDDHAMGIMILYVAS